MKYCYFYDLSVRVKKLITKLFYFFLKIIYYEHRHADPGCSVRRPGCAGDWITYKTTRREAVAMAYCVFTA
jgi:hypothetical protein